MLLLWNRPVSNSMCTSIVFTAVLASALGGCGSQESMVGAGASAAVPTDFWLHKRESGMLPGATAVKKIVYISDWETRAVYAYDYRTENVIGKLTGFKKPEGQCVDANGDIWITDLTSTSRYVPGSIKEYAHGGTQVLRKFQTRAEPVGCSVAPNGDLAVTTNLGYFEVWKGASGLPNDYSGFPCMGLRPPGYDSSGNLYAEGYLSGVTLVCELPKGSSKVKSVAFDKPINDIASVMWDGRYLTLTDGAFTTTIYRVVRKRTGLVTVGSTVLTDNCNGDGAVVAFPFIVGERNTPVNREEGYTVVGGNAACSGRFGYWQYLAGGNPSRVLPFAPAQPTGSAVSIGP
jgi:hypothetical protein